MRYKYIYIYREREREISPCSFTPSPVRRGAGPTLNPELGPATSRVILQLSPSNKGVYQMLTWLGNGAEYARSFSAQPLGRLTTSGEDIVRTRVHRCAMNITNI